MNGINGVAGSPALWSQASTPEGRIYYYNTQTKETQWTKPLELMSPAEVSYLLIRGQLILTIPASSCKSAMEGAYHTRREEVLVQHGDKAELLGDARGLQECARSDCPYSKILRTVRCRPFQPPMTNN